MTREKAILNLKILKEDYWDDDGYGQETEMYEDTMFALDMAIKALEQEPKTEWIPVSERLPEDHDWYLIVVKEKSTGYQYIPRVATHLHNNDWLIIDTKDADKDWLDDLECIAWCPLPEPYKESEG